MCLSRRSGSTFRAHEPYCRCSGSVAGILFYTNRPYNANCCTEWEIPRRTYQTYALQGPFATGKRSGFASIQICSVRRNGSLLDKPSHETNFHRVQEEAEGGVVLMAYTGFAHRIAMRVATYETHERLELVHRRKPPDLNPRAVLGYNRNPEP
jgi:hypothetical protein